MWLPSRFFWWPEHQKKCKSSERVLVHPTAVPGQEKVLFVFICLPNAVNAIPSHSHELSSIQEKQPRLTLPWCNYGPKHAQSLWSRSEHQLKGSGSLVFKPDIIKFQVQEPSPAPPPSRAKEVPLFLLRCTLMAVLVFACGTASDIIRYGHWLPLEKIELATSWFVFKKKTVLAHYDVLEGARSLAAETPLLIHTFGSYLGKWLRCALKMSGLSIFLLRQCCWVIYYYIIDNCK